jgi:hypothetical protein
MPVETGGSNRVFADATAGSRGRAAVNDGPQLPSQQGIRAPMALSPDSETQHDEHNAESGAARKAAPIKTRTAKRKRLTVFSKPRSIVPRFPDGGAESSDLEEEGVRRDA